MRQHQLIQQMPMRQIVVKGIVDEKDASTQALPQKQHLIAISKPKRDIQTATILAFFNPLSH